jgi:hypothetical protein
MCECEKRIGEVAGDRWRGDLAKQVVALADGPAFFLEELIRIVAARDESSDQFQLPEPTWPRPARLARLDDQTSCVPLRCSASGFGAERYRPCSPIVRRSRSKAVSTS